MRLVCGVMLCVLLARAVGASASPASLGVILTADPRVSVAARKALIEEVTRIWDQAGVQLESILPELPRPSTVPTLRVLAIPWPALPAPSGGTILGQLIRTGESGAVGMLSLDEAERIATQSPQHADISRDQRLGIILGRAAAHEIGHYLLNTPTHTDHGLMRAHFDDKEFRDPQSHSFELDGQSRASVQHRLQNRD